MAGATIQIDEAQMAEIRESLAEIKNGAEKAMRSALNRTLSGAKTLTAQELIAKVTLRSGYVKDTLIDKKATLNRLSATLRIPYSYIPLAAFQTTPTASTGLRFGDNTGNGVLVKVWKDAPSVRFRHAFFALMKNGYIGLFVRKNNADGTVADRLPIDELKGPSLPAVYEKTPGLAIKVEQTSAERLLRELESNVNYLLLKQAGQIPDV